MTSAMLAYYLLNTNRFVLEGARRTRTGLYHDATSTGSVTLYADADGVLGAPLAGSAWPLPLIYIAGSRGNFDAEIPATVGDALADGMLIWYQVTLVAPGGQRYGDLGTARCRYPSGA